MEPGKPGRRTFLLGGLLGAAAVAGVALYVLRRLRGCCPFIARSGQTVNVPDKVPTEAAVVNEPAVESSPEQAVESPPEQAGTTPLKDIEGIGAVYVEQLEALGLRTFDDLLTAGASPKGREELAAAVGVGAKLVLRWVNQVDLCRVGGVGPQYADLLEAAGVDTVPELAQRRADNLTKRMAEVNEKKQLVRGLPAESQVAGWIEAAKALPRIVTY